MATIRTTSRLPEHIRPALLGGLLSGVVGALLFATAHAVIIVPIWTRMWRGLAFGAVAGVAAGWMLVELYPAVMTARPRRAATLGAGLGALLWFLVAPVSLVDAVLRATGFAARHESAEVVVAITIALGTGAAFAWHRTRRWRATLAGALATLLLTVGMAGPVPIGQGRRAVGIFVAVLPVAVCAGMMLSLLVSRLGRIRGQSSPSNSDPEL